MIDQVAHTLRWIEQTLYEHMMLCGYRGFDLPIIHPAEFFLTRAGDTIIERLFSFDRGGLQLALRPEFTAPAAHHYAQTSSGKTVRWQFSGPVFEDTQSGSQHAYQAWSFGAEHIGPLDPMSEAEIIAMAVSGLQKIGISNFRIMIGHVGLLRECMQYYGLDGQTQRLLLTMRDLLRQEDGKARILHELSAILPLRSSENRAIADLDKNVWTQSPEENFIGSRSLDEIWSRLRDKHQRADQQMAIHQVIDFLRTWTKMQGSAADLFPLLTELASQHTERASAVLTDWRHTVELLQFYGIREDDITIQPNITRHWEYYTGLVFQIVKDGHLLAGGGRYDELVHILGGAPTHAFGFAYYAPALLLLAEPHRMPNVWRIYPQHTGAPELLIRWMEMLRHRGIAVVFQRDPQSADLVLAEEDLIWNHERYSIKNIDELVSQLKAHA